MSHNNEKTTGWLPEELILIAPLLALSSTVTVSLSAGLAFQVLLILTAVTMSALRHFIAWPLRIPVLMLVTATWVTLFDMIVTAWLYELREQFGIYLPLLAVNSLVLAVSGEYYLCSGIRKSLSHAWRTGMTVLLLFLAMGTVREVLSYGTLFRDAGVILAGTGFNLDTVQFFTTGPALVRGAPGAFICLALILGIRNIFTSTFSGNLTLDVKPSASY